MLDPQHTVGLVTIMDKVEPVWCALVRKTDGKTLKGVHVKKRGESWKVLDDQVYQVNQIQSIE